MLLEQDQRLIKLLRDEDEIEFSVDIPDLGVDLFPAPHAHGLQAEVEQLLIPTKLKVVRTFEVRAGDLLGKQIDVLINLQIVTESFSCIIV